jgi:hypothetical protein
MKATVPFFVAVLVVGVQTTPASAQDRPSRPFRGIFAGGVGETGQLLTADASIGAGYDDNLRAAATGSGIGRPQASQGGVLGSLWTSINYALNRDTVSLYAGGGLSKRYYPDVEPSVWTSNSASVGAHWQMSTRTSFSVGSGIHYRPFTLNGLFPVSDAPFVTGTPAPAVEPVYLDQASSQDGYLSYTSSAGVGHRLSRRATLGVNYLFRGAEASSYSGDFHQHGVNGALDFEVSRGFGWGVGYGIRRTYYTTRIPTNDHHIRASVNYNRALSFSRRTQLSFSTGSAAVTSETGRTQFRATGMASLTHELGRTWTAGVNYTRGVRFVDTLSDPLFGHSVSATVAGLLTRRLHFASNTHANLGTTNGRNYDVFYQSFTLQMAVNRFMSVSSIYSYYFYEFEQGVPLAPGVPNDVDRQSVRVFASLWAPIFQRARRTNASR